MIAPDQTVRVLKDRPPLELNTSVNLFAHVLRPLMRWYRQRARARQHARLDALIKLAKIATSRSDLERSVGKPIYALDGDGYLQALSDGVAFVPDRVEVYKRHGCVLELWFEGTLLRSVTGYVEVTALDVAAGLIGETGADSFRG